MKRLERDGRILYVRRHIGWSIVFISLSLTMVLFAWLFPSQDKKELGVTIYYGVPLAVAATIATLRSQMVAIDRQLGRVLFVDRQLLRPRRRFRDLSRLSVLLKTVRSADGSRPHHYIWIEIEDDLSFLFRLRHGSSPPLSEAEQLAADLGRPLIVEDKTAG